MDSNWPNLISTAGDDHEEVDHGQDCPDDQTLSIVNTDTKRREFHGDKGVI